MSKMKKDEGKAIELGFKPKTKLEKENKRKSINIIENQNLALVNLRLSIEQKRAEKLQRNLHMIDLNQG